MVKRANTNQVDLNQSIYDIEPFCDTCNFHFYVNEREEFMQETQHTQQTVTRTAQNQDKKTT